MNRTTFTHAKKNPGKFGDRTGGFQKHINNEMRTLSVSISGRAKQALALLMKAGTKGVTQAQALIEGNGWRLAASVHMLRRKGFAIATHREYRPNGTWCARYVLLGFSGGVRHEQ